MSIIETNHAVRSVSMKRKRSSGNITDQISNNLPPRKIVRVVSALPARLRKTGGKPLPKPSSTLTSSASASITTLVSPQEHLISVLKSQGVEATVHSYNALTDFFEDTKQSEIDAYDFDVLKAIRELDLEQLRHFHRQGRPLKCSNRFGESLLHMACRKGLVPVVQFLVHDAGVPLRVVDDMGRSPLHDAFWTTEPNFELIDLIIKECPDLLLISDKRGHTPLSYARQHHWNIWIKYLDDRSTLLKPTVVNQPQH